MELELRGKRVLVTGGTRGIGRATAIAYAREGADVTITYATDAATAAAVVDEIDAAGGQGAAARLDLDDEASIRGAVAAAASDERLDVLVANAVRWPGELQEPLGESTAERWADVVRANLEGTATCLRVAFPCLARSDAGRVVLISSGVARAGLANASSYTAAKAGLEGLAATLKWEGGEHGVLVNVVSPGVTTTENHLADVPHEVLESFRERTPTLRLSRPEDVAAAVLFLGSPGNGNVSGVCLPVSGGID